MKKNYKNKNLKAFYKLNCRGSPSHFYPVKLIKAIYKTKGKEKIPKTCLISTIYIRWEHQDITQQLNVKMQNLAEKKEYRGFLPTHTTSGLCDFPCSCEKYILLKNSSGNFPKYKFKFLYFKVIKDAIHRQDKAALRDTY